ncbi:MULTISPECIES: hypothetical protein [Sellimonas]|uniref:Bypass of forespore C C-terminal domain-containing protein n=1 Tax=Sellimonas caecigallum TaxID=2592333 RepID=A0ABS7L9J4_9FIRM|nr:MULTISPECIES: hypothetical protein [Sellimonas]MBY0759584.1 hypothetical protein [Sellimonas caecigallum]OUP02131.1 hypothetical protein B5F37_04530 [Drancourtella sp. An210]OUP62884.1 hypothetical protein B5F13_12165 [Drancourtella sp. An177]
MKRYGIWYCVIFACCLGLLGAAYQISFHYAEEKARQEAKIEEAKIQEAQKEAGYEVSAKGSKGEDEVFYLMDLNGFVAVYKSDKTTIYEYTNIVTADLPEDVRQEIEKGKEIRTVKKLYGFLENYSS